MSQYQAARNQPLGVGSHIVARSGDHVALARREHLQSGSRHFFRGFWIPSDEARLACDFVKFGNCRTWAERADANAMRPHFLSESLGEQEIEGFGCGIGGNVGHGLKGSSRSQNQYVTGVAFDHAGKKQAREVDHGRAIHLHHVQLPLRFRGGEFAVTAEACVVDQQGDFDAFFACEGEDFLRRIGVGEICCDNLGANFVRRGEFPP